MIKVLRDAEYSLGKDKGCLCTILLAKSNTFVPLVSIRIKTKKTRNITNMSRFEEKETHKEDKRACRRALEDGIKDRGCNKDGS